MITYDYLGEAEAADNVEIFSRLRDTGRQAAATVRTARSCHAHVSKQQMHELQLAIARRSHEGGHAGHHILDNMRLIRTAVRDVRDSRRALRSVPGAVDGDCPVEPRPCVVAKQYLKAAEDAFSEDGLGAFLDGFQEVVELEMAEIWALRAALQLAILEHIVSAEPQAWPTLVTSLRQIGEGSWREFFESENIVDRVLAQDPAGAYSAMDSESRDLYREAVAGLSKHSGRPEHEIADAAVSLARQAAAQNASRASHVGFFLIDKGLPQLRAMVGYHAPLKTRVRDFLRESPNGYYLVGVELITFVIVIGLLSALDTFTPVVAGFLLLILPATQAAVEFMNNLTTSLLRARALPKLDFSKGIPEDCATIVAVPTLLLNEAQVRNLALDLEIRFLANRDPNLYFALLTDWPDCEEAPSKVSDQRDALLDLARERVEDLNHRYGSNGRGPFYLFHRHRVFNPSEGRWMGWERKRGKLLDLNQYVRGGFDSFPVKIGDLSALPGLRYVITLDSDTQLPRGSAARLIGAIAHPLNRAVIDPVTKMVVEGYGILQPRIGISIESASRSRLASIYSGQTGFDIYTRAISDVYQDLYGEGIFTGKGIYEIDVFRETLQQRFPENALLSHDLIEGSYARAGLVSDIELIDDYPSHFSAYSRRKHRWVRGDWQILRWLFSPVVDYHGRKVANPLTLISRWKIFDNLRRSLIEPVTLLLLLAGWFYLPGGALYWTAATLAMLFMPVYADLLFSLIRVPWKTRLFGAWAKDTASTFIKGNIVTVLSIIFLLHQALLSIDAIVRSILRVFVTRRKLLEWETAAEAETDVRPKSTVDVYLEWTPWIAILIAFAVCILRPADMSIALPVVGLWFISRGISDWLNCAPRASNRKLNAEDTQFVRESAEKIWRFFHDWSSPTTNWLIPDNVREDGTVAARLSPTNLGLLLNARVAAVHFGHLTLAEFALETQQTLERLCALPKYRGHILNWYDINTLAPLEPRFVSTVDSGNLAASLWTVKQAALAFASEPKRGATAKLAAELKGIAETCERLVEEMDFSFLYQRRKKVMSVGYHVTLGRLEPSSYDLLASEARIASFVAIAKGDIPQQAWFNLGRTHTLSRGERALISWTGTMFEYFMPALWTRLYEGTIIDQTLKAVVRIQREYARRKGVPWGISESACRPEEGSEPGYAAFGIPELAMKATDPGALVISPYSSFLALGTDPEDAIKNLRRMEEFGWSGRYGFYEAVDYAEAGGEIIRSWMAHHQGMSLLAACNLLFNNPIQRHFHAEPQVMATELLLHERIPSTVVVDEEEIGSPELAPAEA